MVVPGVFGGRDRRTAPRLVARAGVFLLAVGAWLLPVPVAPTSASATSPRAVVGAHSFRGGDGSTFAPAAANGPLTVDSRNPRYFTDGLGGAVLLAGAHTWNNRQDLDGTVFDFNGYLDFLVARNHNFFRLWVWEEARGSDSPVHENSTLLPTIYARTGPGVANDGLPKFDLIQFNAEHFDRLRARVVAAGERGLYVSVMLFNGWSVEHKSSRVPVNPWICHPFNADNNVNGIDGDSDHDGSGAESHTLLIPEVTRLQEAYVRKVIDTVNDLDNVLFEISNESDADSTAWQYQMIEFIKAYEATKPKRHPVGMTFQFRGGSNADLFASPADWISPNVEAPAPYDYALAPPPAEGSKVIVSDTDHLWGLGGDRVWAWKSFCQGTNLLYMDTYLHDWFADPQDPSLEANLGYIRNLAAGLDLEAMVPRGDLSSTGYCLADPGRSLVVYQPDPSTPFSVSLPAGTYQFSWLNPTTGSTVAAGTVISQGGDVGFTAPFDGDGVLQLTVSTEPITGLVAAYAFDEGFGGTVADLSGNGNTGTISNATWTAAGKYGDALVFDGASARVTIDDSALLRLTTGMTLEAWVNPSAVGNAWRDVIYKGNDNYYLEGTSDSGGHPAGGGTFGGANANAYGATALEANTWTHLAVTYDGAALRFYVNGAQVSTVAKTGSIATSTDPLQIGGDRVWGQYFQGTIDEVRVYNVALTAAQIQSDMNTPVGSSSDTQPPTAPTGLAAAAVDGRDIDLSWTASTDDVGVTGYFVERCKGVGCSNLVQIGSTTATTSADTGLVAGMSYSYRVRALDAAGNLSPYSNTVSATTPEGPTGLVAAYAFDEGFGGTVADLSGNGNTGTISNATWTAAGKYGDALVFDGTSARVTIDDSALLRLTTGMTLEAWVNPSAVGNAWRDVIYKGNDNYYLEGTSDSGGRPAGGGTFGGANANAYGTTALEANTWTHLAVTYDGAALRFYVNGAQVSTVAKTGSIATSTDPLQIGGDRVWGQSFQGTLDEVRVYNVALTQAQIQADRDTSIGATVPDLGLTKTHTGSFTLGQTGATYTITVSNVGTGPTSGTVTVTDTLPAGLTASAIASTGWGCTLTPTLGCTRSDALAAQAGYPAITLTVNVAASAAPSLTNTATVSGGGDATPGNNTANDLTAIGSTISGLVAAYSFNETTGTTVTDASGNGNTGSIANATRTTSGKYGGALLFNGTTALVTINDSASLRLTTAMTLEAWVNPSTVSSAWRDVIYKGDDNFFLEGTSDSGGNPGAGGSFSSNPLYGTTALAANTWSHLAATYDGATMRLYVNGVQVASRAQTGAIQTSTSPLQIGGDSLYGQYFSGTIDEVRVYNVALTLAQIQADRDAPI